MTISILLVINSWHGVSNTKGTNKTDADMIKKEIYFAGGCFWGTEHFFKQIEGVLEVTSGYANGTTEYPTYKEVCTGQTGFAETVQVVYNPEVVSLSLLLDLYLKTIDPTLLNRQGNDIGSQYRTGIYFNDSADESLITEALTKLQKEYTEPIVVENTTLLNFYEAEEYHQDYLDKNPTGYCHLHPSLFEFAKKANKKSGVRYQKLSDEDLKNKLNAIQYHVTQENGTERAFQNEYWDETKKGIYVDITTGEPLFTSSDKFDAGCGWPSFSKPITNELIVEKKDSSHGMTRIEVRSKLGDAHLGHVFNDGPRDRGGLRYCINSASLRFISLEDMTKEGYEAYIKLIK